MAHWIISAGSNGRDYSGAFLRHGLAFVGGDGPLATMRQVKTGDRILLKRGLSQIIAVGEVVGDGIVVEDGEKDWLRDFDGWDLPGYCRVEWRKLEAVISASGLRQGTIYRTNQATHLAIAEQAHSWSLLPREPEPAATLPIGDEEILRFLILQGLRPAAADDLTTTLRRIRLLASYYYDQGDWESVREHETRTFLVAPLLLALGWAEQQMKIELPAGSRRVDLACFQGPYRGRKEDCVLLIETKDFSSGLDYAPAQAIGYSKEFPNCQVVVVTNGYCYKTYVRGDSGEFSLDPSAYLNLLRPRRRYPLNPTAVGGALEVLQCLLPSGLGRKIGALSV